MIFRESIPPAAPTDIIAWAEENTKVDGHSFDASRTPQVIEPLKAAHDPATRIVTYVKPVQCGGSTLGEVMMAYWCRYSNGKIQFNWQDDQKAAERWRDRILPVLQKTPGLRWAGGNDDNICNARFVNASMVVQGVISKGALDSETIPIQINEEIHLWAAGLLDKARRRQTMVWNAKALDISNAGCEGDQLQAAFETGSMEIWENLCPSCGKYHVMRFRWDPKRPELGGLRFDTGAGRLNNGKYNFQAVYNTIRYQMPCGHVIANNIRERRLPGRYLRTNEGAPSNHRSFNFEAVSVSEIRWEDLVSEWLTAIRAKKTGDMKPLEKFVQERECKFWSPEMVPYSGQIVINTAFTKSRDGFPDRALRQAHFDWQQGYKSKGQLTHYWGVIRDVKQDCNSIIVWEGMVDSDIELIALLKDYDVDPAHVTIDASKNTKPILTLCYQNGFKAVMGNASHKGSFRDHPDGVPRFYSAGKPIHSELNVPPVYEYVFGERKAGGDVAMIPDPREPMVIQYNLGGLLANHFYCRNLKARVSANTKQEKPPRDAEPHEYFEMIIPGDVSEEFEKQFNSWEPLAKDAEHKAGDIKSQSAEAFRQLSTNDHMLMCVAYADMFLDWLFLLGDAIANLGIKTETENNE